MYKFILFILFAFFVTTAFAEKSPHGEKLKINCVVCHNTDDWKKIKTGEFNHNKTNFALMGQHKTVGCKKCHPTLEFAKAKTECSACHVDIHQETVGQDCARCHTTNSWIVTNIQQIHQQQGFTLIGAHASADCSGCHTSGSRLRFDNINTDCFACHKTQYEATTKPNHTTAKFSTDCQSCHNSTAWQPSTFNHNMNTTFPLTGAHIGVACVTCHTNGFTAIPTTCVSCHLANFNVTTNPNHTTAKFSTDCQTCHNTSAWQPSTFNHSTATTFPLTGAHVGVACITCHTNGYAAIPSTCVSCHLANFNATTNPNHTTAKFSTDCQTCHSTTTWNPSTFNHSTATTFPLTGAHIGVSCISCHTKGYAAIPTTCVSCHLTNYNATTNPGHSAAKFPTTCETCHSTINWTSSTFNHTSYFPITNGNHNVSCTICHTNSTNYAVFTCLTASCHTNAHNRNQGSSGCYSCHPTGRGGG